MNLLSQNWGWVVLGLGVVFFFSRAGHRGGGMGGCGGSNRSDGSQSTSPSASSGTSAREESEARPRRRGGC